MKRYLLLVLFCLSACVSITPQATQTPYPTYTPYPTQTLTPTYTSEPTKTPKPTVLPTKIPTPTVIDPPTRFSNIVKSVFNLVNEDKAIILEDADFHESNHSTAFVMVIKGNTTEISRGSATGYSIASVVKALQESKTSDFAKVPALIISFYDAKCKHTTDHILFWNYVQELAAGKIDFEDVIGEIAVLNLSN